MPIRLLLIEDEAAIRDLIHHTLPEAEFLLMEAASVKQAEALLHECIPDVMVVDWMLPGKSGVEFIAWLRRQALYQSIPVILLSANAEERHKVEGLGIGADDYLTKPFSPAEYKLLHFFITHPNKIFTREQLLNFIWGMSVDVDERAVDAAIKRLREKLKPHGHANTIQTRRGAGYLFGKNHD